MDGSRAGSGRRPVQTAAEAQAAAYKAIQSLLVIFVLLVFLGFPGTLSKVIGSSVCKLLEYRPSAFSSCWS